MVLIQWKSSQNLHQSINWWKFTWAKCQKKGPDPYSLHSALHYMKNIFFFKAVKMALNCRIFHSPFFFSKKVEKVAPEVLDCWKKAWYLFLLYYCGQILKFILFLVSCYWLQCILWVLNYLYVLWVKSGYKPKFCSLRC